MNNENNVLFLWRENECIHWQFIFFYSSTKVVWIIAGILRYEAINLLYDNSKSFQIGIRKSLLAYLNGDIIYMHKDLKQLYIGINCIFYVYL